MHGKEIYKVYQWNQSREQNYQGQFHFYYSIVKNSVSKGSKRTLYTRKFLFILKPISFFKGFYTERIN